MVSFTSTVRSSSPSSAETTRKSRRDSLQSRITDDLSAPGLSQTAHLHKTNASQSPPDRSPSSFPVHHGTLNPLVQNLDEQPDYPDPQSYLALELSASDPVPGLPDANPPPIEFAPPTALDHSSQQPEPPAPEGPYSSEVSTHTSVPLSLALQQLSLWDEVPPDFPQQVALFLAQEAQEKPAPEIPLHEEEKILSEEAEANSNKQEEKEEEPLTIHLNLNPGVAAAVQTSLLSHSTQQNLIASIKAPRSLAEELQRLVVGDGVPSIDAVLLQGRELVFGVQIFREGV
ncbi:MAG: hypothetical protein Q9195_007720 [Heterodermia aff. obscurata]